MTTTGGGKCAKCGLRIMLTTLGWQHLTTVAGREAEADHAAQTRGEATR